MAELVLNVHDTTGAVLNVVDGTSIVHRVLRGPVEVAGAGGGSPTGGAGGFLSGSYPNPGVNQSALATAVDALIEAGDGIVKVFDPGPGEDPPSLTISATGGGGASLDVILYLDPESLVTVGDLGGSFDGGTMSIPAFSATPIGGRLLVMSEGNANDGIWTHQGDGDFNQTVAAFQLLTADYGGLEIAYGITLSSGSSGSVRVSTTDGGTTWALIDTSSIAWTSLTDVPERITALENFRRPTLINARLHFGGEAAWDGGDPLPNLFDPDTGEFLGPIYDAAFITANGSLYNYNDDGSQGAAFDATDTPIIDHMPWGGGSVMATQQTDWEANGIWTLAYDAGDGKWYGIKPTTLDWATDDMIVEGTPFWIGSGRYHRFKVGAWGFNGTQPTDPGHTWNFHRNEASDNYYTPGEPADWPGGAPNRVSDALDDLGAKLLGLVATATGASGATGPGLFLLDGADFDLPSAADHVGKLLAVQTGGADSTINPAAGEFVQNAYDGATTTPWTWPAGVYALWRAVSADELGGPAAGWVALSISAEQVGATPDAEWTELARFTTASANDWPTFSSVPTRDRYRLRWYRSPTATPATSGGIVRSLTINFDGNTTSGDYFNTSTGGTALAMSVLPQGGGGHGEIELLRTRFDSTRYGLVGESNAVCANGAGQATRISLSHAYRLAAGGVPALSTWALAASNNDAWAAGWTFILEGADLP